MYAPIGFVRDLAAYDASTTQPFEVSRNAAFTLDDGGASRTKIHNEYTNISRTVQ